MKYAPRIAILLFLPILFFLSCSSQLPFSFPALSTPSYLDSFERPIIDIPLKGPVARRKAQLSGLAWYGDNLILLPQYPERFEYQVFYLAKEEIINSLLGSLSEPLRPHAIPVQIDDSITQIPGFQGFEAIAFEGERAFLTIEVKAEDQMIGYLVSGIIEPDLSALRILSGTISPIAAQTPLNNVSDEAIFLADSQIVTLYEVNGAFVNLSPVAHTFSVDSLQFVNTISFPHIDYRITDATPLDAADRFWAINSFSLPTNPLSLGLEALAVKYGVGSTHQASQAVERLVEFQYTSTGISLVDAPPVQLQLLDDAARNWEGIARLESAKFSGFLLATDRHPSTILAFVPYVFD